MNGRFAELEREGRIEAISAGRAEVERLHVIVARDIATAEELQERNRDWSLAIAYNAILQACVALMAAHGHRARGERQHATIVQFARLALPGNERELDRVDRLRRRRHRTVYDVAGQVSANEVEDALRLSQQIIPSLQDAALRILKGE